MRRFSVLDADMRWKSEVKVECCAVNDNEDGSLLSNDEVSERLTSISEQQVEVRVGAGD